MRLRTIFALAALTVAPSVSQAKEPLTMWFWGTPPAYREVLDTALVQPFNSSQDQYELSIEYYPQGGGVDNAVRVALIRTHQHLLQGAVAARERIRRFTGETNVI